MPINSNEKQENVSNQADRSSTASSPIVSVVKNEIYPPANQSSAADKAKRLTMQDGYPESIITDPNGSYTGTPLNPAEVPVQDVDDL